MCTVTRCRMRLKYGTRAETRFRPSAKRTSPFKLVGTSVQSITGSRGVRISGSNAGYTMFRGSVKGTGYPLHSPVSTSLLLPWVTVCHHVSTGLCRSWTCRWYGLRCLWLHDVCGWQHGVIDSKLKSVIRGWKKGDYKVTALRNKSFLPFLVQTLLTTHCRGRG